jgi:hypothetical protein
MSSSRIGTEVSYRDSGGPERTRVYTDPSGIWSFTWMTNVVGSIPVSAVFAGDATRKGQHAGCTFQSML